MPVTIENVPPRPWHQGKINPHVIYAADQTTVVVCLNNETAQAIVLSVNGMETLVKAFGGDEANILPTCPLEGE